MTKRAAAAQQSRQRILESALERFMASYYSDVTLQDIADGAGVTLQTVLRRFESKEKLFLAVMQYAGGRVPDQRDKARPGDVESAVDVVVETLETYGDSTMRARHQAEQIDVLAPFIEHGHAWHREWVARMFAPCLSESSAEKRRQLAALRVALDVYAWRLLRRDYGLSKVETKRVMLALVRGLVNRSEKGSGT